MRLLVVALATPILAGCATVQNEVARTDASRQPESGVALREVTRADELAQLLEFCAARSPLREYKSGPVNHDTVGVLLTVASADLDDIQGAARKFLARASSDSDLTGREDLLELLLGLIVDYPDRGPHVADQILVNRDGTLKIEGAWPGDRIGAWRPRAFVTDVAEGVRMHGRRELAEFIAKHEFPQIERH